MGKASLGYAVIRLSVLSVIKIPNLSLTRRATFWKKTAAALNIASMSVSKIRVFQGRKSINSVTCSFIVDYKYRQFRGIPVKWKWTCRKGLPGLQRGPYGIATKAPLQCGSGPAATPGGP